MVWLEITFLMLEVKRKSWSAVSVPALSMGVASGCWSLPLPGTGSRPLGPGSKCPAKEQVCDRVPVLHKLTGVPCWAGGVVPAGTMTSLLG